MSGLCWLAQESCTEEVLGEHFGSRESAYLGRGWWHKGQTGPKKGIILSKQVSVISLPHPGLDGVIQRFPDFFPAI